MIQLPRLIIIGLFPIIMGASYGVEGTAGNEEGSILQSKQEQVNEVNATYLGDVEMDEDWDASNPTKRKDGVYKSGKLEGGVWDWDFEPKQEASVSDSEGLVDDIGEPNGASSGGSVLDEEAIQDYIDAENEKGARWETNGLTGSSKF